MKVLNKTSLACLSEAGRILNLVSQLNKGQGMTKAYDDEARMNYIKELLQKACSNMNFVIGEINKSNFEVQNL